MMYKNNFAAAVKVNGKVLREFNGTFYIPFGSEYSIFLKNMNSRRALVNITIDGQDVMENSSLVIDANSSVNLERFVRDATKGNRFKFIERTSKIEQHRGIDIEDGLIRIEFAFEKAKPIFQNIFGDYPAGVRRYDLQKMSTPQPYFGDVQCITKNIPIGTQAGYASSSLMSNCSNINSTFSDVGITVEGSISNQKFQTVSSFDTDASEVMVLKLAGDIGQNIIQTPVVVKRTVACKTCGTKNKQTAKFCSDCGTSLEII